MNYNSSIWTAGITWNTNSLTGGLLETFIVANRMNMYVVDSDSVKSSRKGYAYFSSQPKEINIK